MTTQDDLAAFIGAHKQVLSTTPLPVCPERGLELVKNKIEEVSRLICRHYRTAFPDDESIMVPVAIVRSEHAAGKRLEIQLYELKAISTIYQELINRRN